MINVYYAPRQFARVFVSAKTVSGGRKADSRADFLFTAALAGQLMTDLCKSC